MKKKKSVLTYLSGPKLISLHFCVKVVFNYVY
jgi:hypothetical protein